MPSPFPGMDPFLEHPAIFADLQAAFAAELSTQINRDLPDPYYAGLKSRIWVDIGQRFVEPDVHVLHPAGRFPRRSPEPNVKTQVELATSVQPVVIHGADDEFRELTVEIYAEPGGECLVTHIEILSYSDKQAGSKGRELYLDKQREILQAQVNLIEIDLLRGGEHTIAVPPLKLQRKTPPHDYRICLHRFNQWVDYVVYPIPLPARLPKIPIPLLPGDPDVTIDLQAVLANCYETGRYERRVRYQLDRLEPPLTPEQQAWAAQVLQKAGTPANS